MGDLRNLNRAVQSAEFPSHEWAQAVREMLNEVEEKMEGGMKTCPHCGDLTTIDHNADDGTPEGQWLCSEPAKVECPNCGEMTSYPHGIKRGGKECYLCPCKPAQPEPAPPVGEMPHELRNAAAGLRREAKSYSDGSVTGMQLTIAADRLETFWRTHAAQPKVAMTRELERVLGYAHNRAQWRRGKWPYDPGAGRVSDDMEADIAAVRAQAAGVKLPKVREFVRRYAVYAESDKGQDLLHVALAELDAAEGKATG